MKFLVATALTALLSFAIGLFTFLPWFSFVICAFIVALAVHQKPLKAFGAGFIAVFVLWIILAAIMDSANEHILSKKVAAILPLGGSYIALLIVTGIVGGLLAGMGALTGSYLRKVK
jgi:uncharacterized membrane protein YhaH (DUF805 family)